MKLLYIHGLNSDRNSRKYLELKAFFGSKYDFDCLEWKNDDNIENLLTETEKEFANEESIILFGDSTGANFAWQLREIRHSKNLKSTLIITSPLLDESKRIAVFEFPKPLKAYLKKIRNLENLMAIVPTQDEVIDHSWIFEKDWNNAKILKVNDTHRLLNFKEYLPKIKDYLIKSE